MGSTEPKASTWMDQIVTEINRYSELLEPQLVFSQNAEVDEEMVSSRSSCQGLGADSVDFFQFRKESPIQHSENQLII